MYEGVKWCFWFIKKSWILLYLVVQGLAWFFDLFLGVILWAHSLRHGLSHGHVPHMITPHDRVCFMNYVQVLHDRTHGVGHDRMTLFRILTKAGTRAATWSCDLILSTHTGRHTGWYTVVCPYFECSHNLGKCHTVEWPLFSNFFNFLSNFLICFNLVPNYF